MVSIMPFFLQFMMVMRYLILIEAIGKHKSIRDWIDILVSTYSLSIVRHLTPGFSAMIDALRTSSLSRARSPK